MTNKKNLEKALKLFNLTPVATLDQIKNVYRKLAKENHPDRFTEDKEKKNQEKKMIEIIEAYEILAANFKNLKNIIISEKKESDYTLYKKGLEFYNTYFDSFFQLFSKRAVKTINEKETVLIKSKNYFIELLKQYPESSWSFDVKEKLKKIEDALEVLNKTKDTYKNLNLKDSKHY